MKILIINKFLYPKGGAETYVLALGEMLRNRGHQVQYFGLENGKNTAGNRIHAYAADLDFSTGILKNLHAPFRIIYNAPARRKLRAVLADFQPDVVHFNNIQFHLTPAVISEAARYRRCAEKTVKLVYTAHDYQLICPSHGLFNGKMKPCEKCLDGHYSHCIQGKCVKNSRAKSILAALDAYFWKHNGAYDAIDTIICPSTFLKSKLDANARFQKKTVAIRNFAADVVPVQAKKKDYVLEFGHLSRDKGTETLLQAAKNLPRVRFVFAGFGESVKSIAEIPNAEYAGFQKGEALKKLIAGAAVTICPSEVYENCPYSVIESQRLGTPVIGARIGGIPELISEGETGELFEAGNVRELEEKLRKVLFTPGLCERYRENCKTAKFETSESYYEKLMAVYGGTHENL